MRRFGIVLFATVLWGGGSAHAAHVGWQEVLPEGFDAFELKHLKKGDILRLFRTFDIAVEKTEYSHETFFVRFSDERSRRRGRALVQRLDVSPEPIAIHYRLIREGRNGGESLNDESLVSLLRERFPSGNFTEVDRASVTLNTGDKGQVYLDGRYQISVKPKRAERGLIKLDGLTVRDLQQQLPDDTPEDPAGDTRLIKTNLTLREGVEALFGSWTEDGQNWIGVVRVRSTTPPPAEKPR